MVLVQGLLSVCWHFFCTIRRKEAKLDLVSQVQAHQCQVEGNMQVFQSAGYTHANVLQGCTGVLCSACYLSESPHPLFQSRCAVIQAPSLCVFHDPSQSCGFYTFSFVFRKFLMTHSPLAQVSLDNMGIMGEKNLYRFSLPY